MWLLVYVMSRYYLFLFPRSTLVREVVRSIFFKSGIRSLYVKGLA